MSDHCRLDPCVYIGRIYPDKVDTRRPLSEMGDYVGIFTVTVQGAVAVISAMHGKFSKTVYRDLKDQLRKMGVSKVIWERHKNGGVVQRLVRI